MAFIDRKRHSHAVLLTTLIVLSNLNLVHSKQTKLVNFDIKQNDLSMPAKTRQYPPYYGGGSSGGCPLCDSSVYSYCSHKIIHDICCCNFPAQQKPPQCYYNDCSLLYAKSCYEHALIKNCCCNSPY